MACPALHLFIYALLALGLLVGAWFLGKKSPGLLFGPKSDRLIVDQPPRRVVGWTALILALAGPAFLIFVLERGVVDQLSDVFSPSTAFDPGGPTTFRVCSCLSHSWLFRNERVFPLGWILTWLVALFVGYRLMRTFIRLGWLVANQKPSAGAAHPDVPIAEQVWSRQLRVLRSRHRRLNDFLTGLAQERPRLARFLLKARWCLAGWITPVKYSKGWRWLLFRSPLTDVRQLTGAEAFRRLWFEVFVWIPATFAVCAGLIMALLSASGAVSPQPIALGFAFTLLLVLVESIALLVLALGLGVGTRGKAWIVAPYVVLFALLFAPWTDFPDTARANERYAESLPSLEHIRNSPSDLPFVGIACSGGGSRAALFAAGVLGELWWCDRGPLSGKDRADARIKLTRHLSQEEVDRVVPPNEKASFYPGRLALLRADVVSSVSGGSLASAQLAHLIIQNPNGASSGYALRAVALDRAFPSPNPEIKATMRSLSQVKANTDRFDDLTEQLVDLVEKADRLPRKRSFLGDMAADHLGAVIAGFAQVWEGRGRGIEDFWREQLAWPAGTKEATFSALCPYEKTGLLPHLVLNATRVSTGGRVAITNLSGDLFRPLHALGPVAKANSLTKELRSDLKSQARLDPTPGMVLTLRDLVPHEDISLARAVRASSNFPFGFPLMGFDGAIVNDQPLELTDGGVLDNTGIDSLMALLRGPRVSKSAFILQIDSGELGSDLDQSPLDEFNHHYTATQASRWRGGQQSNGAFISNAVGELEGLFSSGESLTPRYSPSPSLGTLYVAGYSNSRCGYYRVRLGENRPDHVSTSWHLSREERGKLYCLLYGETVQGAIRKSADGMAYLFGIKE